jgi:hypothetical protein
LSETIERSAFSCGHWIKIFRMNLWNIFAESPLLKAEELNGILPTKVIKFYFAP